MSPEQAKLLLDYPAYRAFWADHIGRPYPKPAPGVIGLADEEVG